MKKNFGCNLSHSWAHFLNWTADVDSIRILSEEWRSQTFLSLEWITSFRGLFSWLIGSFVFDKYWGLTLCWIWNFLKILEWRWNYGGWNDFQTPWILPSVLIWMSIRVDISCRCHFTKTRGYGLEAHCFRDLEEVENDKESEQHRNLLRRKRTSSWPQHGLDDKRFFIVFVSMATHKVEEWK